MSKPVQKKTTPTARPEEVKEVINVDEKTNVKVSGTEVTIHIIEDTNVPTAQPAISISSTSPFSSPADSHSTFVPEPRSEAMINTSSVSITSAQKAAIQSHVFSTINASLQFVTAKLIDEASLAFEEIFVQNKEFSRYDPLTTRPYFTPDVLKSIPIEQRGWKIQMWLTRLCKQWNPNGDQRILALVCRCMLETMMLNYGCDLQGLCEKSRA